MEKKNVLLIFPLEWLRDTAEYTERDNPDLYITENFEQVLGMIRLGEVNRLCIVFKTDNFSYGPYRKVDGQTAAERIHEEFPKLPILIISGRTTLWEKQRGYYLSPIKYENELYLDPKEDLIKATNEFYQGSSLSEYTVLCLGKDDQTVK